MSDINNYVNSSLAPILGVADIWKEKTGMEWSQAKALGLTDGSYEKNMELLKRLKLGRGEDIPFLYDGKDLQEINIVAPKDKRVRQQQTVIKKGNYEGDLPYAIVDKEINKMYLFNDEHNLVGQENVITGRDNKDVDTGLSHKSWAQLEHNAGASNDDYYKYLDKTDQQVTPSGIFTIGAHRDNVTEDPSLLGRVYNMMPWRKERREMIKKQREKAYGKEGKLMTLIDENGVASSKAIHGTGYDDRIQALASAASDGRDMSNGCINVSGETMCFETLEDGSKVFIMPEETDGLLYKKNRETITDLHGKERNVRNFEGITDLVEGKRKLAEMARVSGLNLDKDKLNFIAAVAAKETSFGKDRNINLNDLKHPIDLFQKVGSNLKYAVDNGAYSLGLGDSGGVFQIGHEDFKDYLPENYDWQNPLDQMKVLSNYYDSNIEEAKRFRTQGGKVVTPSRKLYDLYNAGGFNKTSNQSDKFEEYFKILREYGTLSND